jgi:hypothetical protein
MLLAISVCSVAIAIAPGISPAAASKAGQGLHVVPSPQINNSELNAAAVIASNDVWAVGDIATTSASATLAEHFDGSSWSVVPTPSLNAAFSGVAGAASNDVWAVGTQVVNQSSNTLIEHWNGTSWSVVPSPPLPNGSDLTGVTAPASNNAWAVGFAGGSSNALVEHWDGTSWSIVSSPAFAGVFATAISADSATDVWAVNGASSLHWNGQTWSQVPTAPLRFGGVVAVTALSPTNVWAAGTGPGVPTGGFSAHPTEVIEHWNGTGWSVVPSPNPNPQGNNSASGIAAVNASDIWEVGSTITGPFTEHWNGTSWSIVATPSAVASLIGLAAHSDGTVVAVGKGTNGAAIIVTNQPTHKKAVPSI